MKWTVRKISGPGHRSAGTLLCEIRAEGAETPDEIRRAVEVAGQREPAGPELVAQARSIVDSEIEVDDDAQRSGDDGGTWVSAWVWVDDDLTPIPQSDGDGTELGS